MDPVWALIVGLALGWLSGILLMAFGAGMQKSKEGK